MTERFNEDLPRGEGERCLATWWRQSTPGTTYWRCVVPARQLPGQVLPFAPGDIVEVNGRFGFPRMRGETAVWQFLGDDRRSRIAAELQRQGARTLMDVDDNYTKVAPYMRGMRGAPWAATIAEAGEGYSNEMHRMLVPRMDGMIVATEYLADEYSQYNDNVYVCPNSIDPDDWAFEREPHDTFRIVYYGSTSHLMDAPLVTKALKWAAAQPGVEVYTAGFTNPSWSFPHQVVPWSNDIIEARKHLFRFDLGLAPLKGNPWADGKSDVKILEYGMAGLLPLMSRAEPFRPWFDVAPDLVCDADDWVPAIKWAVKNQDDVRTRAAEIKAHILAERTIHSTIHLWKEALHAA